MFRRQRTRDCGPPRSSNGASSLHLVWQVGGAEESAAATLTVSDRPIAAALYFWALQVSFADARGRHLGAAHLGLQWYPSHPESTAVNFGGYAAQGCELDGSSSPLPSATGNPNTRDFPWLPAVPYRLAIAVPYTGTAIGTVDGVEVRRLDVPGATAVASPMVWSEVFADCDAPSVDVVWSALTFGCSPVPAVATSYQRHADGGCTNTCSFIRDDGYVQCTNVGRVVPQGAILRP